MNPIKIDDDAVVRTVERDAGGQSWGERNGPTIFGVSVFISLFLVGLLMWLVR